MRAFVKTALLSAALTLGASSVMAAPGADDWIDHYFKAKIGRPSPAEDARLKAERATLAFREEAPSKVSTPNWIEVHLKGKTGRSTRSEEARLAEARESEAFREAAPTEVVAPNWIEQHLKGKLGRE
jgi:hypothetical protein